MSRPLGPGDSRVALLAGADEDDRAIYGTGLRALGLRTVYSALEDDLPAVVRRLRPAIVVVHLSIPEERGWQLCEALNQHPDSHDIPVAVLTAAIRPDGANRARARRLRNCAAFVAKPCDGDVFAHIVSRILRGESGIELLFGYRSPS